MGNMSYCRFENTVGDLRDCKNALEGLFNTEPEENYPGAEIALSKREARCAQELVAECLEILNLVADYCGENLETILEASQPEVLLSSAIDDAQAIALETDKEEEEREEKEAAEVSDPAASQYTNPEANR